MVSVEGEAGGARKVRRMEAMAWPLSSVGLSRLPRAGEGVERGEGTGTLLQALCLHGEERGPWEEATGRWDRR